jgi:serine/tyrosine/threonine adenylyltransferase
MPLALRDYPEVGVAGMTFGLDATMWRMNGSTQRPIWQSDSLVKALGPGFAVAVAPQAVPQAHWVARNEALAQTLGCADWLASDAALALLSGAQQPEHGTVATVYSGHQFGNWAGQLGDGRALLLGETRCGDEAVEWQLKGAGLTPYSRMGDGRAVLRSSIREYLCSEAVHALGIPTTRALALVGSPLPVRRETLETAAVLTRTAPSFLRFGHFEHFTHTADNPAALKRLADVTIERLYPELLGHTAPYAALLQAVAERTASLLAQWQAVGFCHGVMNTDNMSILGLTIDYGPFGFLDAFDPNHICNHTDQGGRYAYARQPSIAFWNLHALAQALMPLIEDSDAALAALEPYKTAYPEAFMRAMRAKLGLLDAREEDRALIDDLLRLMQDSAADFSITFRRLCSFGSAPEAVRDLFINREAFDAWALRYQARLDAEHSIASVRLAQMQRHNPKYVLRNHLAETAIRQAREGDFSEVQRLATVLANPFDEQPAFEAYAALPPSWASHLEVSCSS